MSTLRDRLFSIWYPRLMSISERAGQADVRAAQLARAEGRILEVGAGSGLSLPHYGPEVTELVLVEPDPDFRRALHASVETCIGTTPPTTVVDADVQNLPFEDASFDTVTASFTFCTVRQPDLGLAELHRVLRPGGQFSFSRTRPWTGSSRQVPGPHGAGAGRAGRRVLPQPGLRRHPASLGVPGRRTSS